METVEILGEMCHLEFSLYENGTISITAVRIADDSPWCVPTVNWTQNWRAEYYAYRMRFPTVVIKNYSENEGVFQNLVNEKVIIPGTNVEGTNGTVKTGILTLKWQTIAQEQLDNYGTQY
ncbi:hypothetical protein [Paraflavitalea sp. CAU 1676]|uniref:hypothetical protein n=1 Tax=Paraflavitalea sp. CAU 1676 TaxID=3032598 RepID=UPI0023DC286F|nr:hypothetical protein [Paraflavitalea sp. CAU 1676]MDF2190490.1 hypothetical protein [Paraflavitalea sp. CAU 1676]